MDFLGLGISTLAIKENNQTLRFLPIIIGIIFGLIIIGLIFFYFKTVELKKDYEKNKEKIEKSYKVIEKLKNDFYKYGVIIFIVLGFTMIILGNFIDL